jgi:hypothetical protein
MTGNHRFVVMGGNYMRASEGAAAGYRLAALATAAVPPDETSRPFTLWYS